MIPEYTTNPSLPGFFSGWVIILFTIGLVGLVYLFLSSHFSKNQEHSDTVWDGDLSEGDAPLPTLYFWLFTALILVSSVYVILYPGLGNFPGIKNWTSGGHHASHAATLNEDTMKLRRDFSGFEMEELQDDSRAMKSAHSLYQNNCAACHGEKADGISGFSPNLKDSDWIWGNSYEQVYTSISQGRNNVMPGWKNALGEQGVRDMTTYIQALSDGTADPDSPSAALYGQICAACHGPNGDGNQLLGAPRLNDDIWLFGNTPEQLYDVIAYGVINDGERWTQSIMPAQKDRLSELEIRLLTAYILLPKEE